MTNYVVTDSVVLQYSDWLERANHPLIFLDLIAWQVYNPHLNKVLTWVSTYIFPSLCVKQWMKSNFWLPNIVRLVNQAVLEARSYPWHLHRPQIHCENGVGITQCSFSSNRRQEKRSISTALSVPVHHNTSMKGINISYLHTCWLFDKLLSENMYYMSSWTAIIYLQNIFHLQITLNITWLIALIKNKCKIFIFNESKNTQKRSDSCVLACPMYIIVSWLLLQKTINILYM